MKEYWVERFSKDLERLLTIDSVVNRGSRLLMFLFVRILLHYYLDLLAKKYDVPLDYSLVLQCVDRSISLATA